MENKEFFEILEKLTNLLDKEFEPGEFAVADLESEQPQVYAVILPPTRKKVEEEFRRRIKEALGIKSMEIEEEKDA